MSGVCRGPPADRTCLLSEQLETPSPSATQLRSRPETSGVETSCCFLPSSPSRVRHRYCLCYLWFLSRHCCFRNLEHIIRCSCFLPSILHSFSDAEFWISEWAPESHTLCHEPGSLLAPYNLYGPDYRDVSSIDVNFFFLFWHVLIFIYTFLRSFFSFLKNLFT